MITYIYGLADPDTGVIRYVGQSTRPQGRYKEHVTYPGGKCSEWIKSLRGKNEKPTLVILETVSLENNPTDREEYWIVELSKNNQLLNRRRPGETRHAKEYPARNKTDTFDADISRVKYAPRRTHYR